MESEPMSDMKSGHRQRGYGAVQLLWFIVIVVVIWLILFATKPTWIQKVDEDGKTTGEVDSGKALLWAIVIAIIICVLIWLFVGYGYNNRAYNKSY